MRSSPVSELNQRLCEVGDFISRNKDALSSEQLRECFSALSESHKSTLRSLLTYEPLEVPKYISQIQSIGLSASLEASVEQWTKDPESFLISTTDSPRLDSIYWRTVERHEQSELATICQRFDDFTIYTIAIESGYHNGIKWNPYGLSEFATRIKLFSPRGKSYSTDEIGGNLDARVSAGCYWSKWLTALAKFDQIDKLGDEQDRTGYLIVLPQGTISEIQYTTRKISAEVRDVAAQTFVHCGITKITREYGLFELGQKLRKVVLTGSVEASINPRTQNERNTSPIESPEGRTFTPASNNKGRKRKLGSNVPRAEPTGPKKTAPQPITSHQVTYSSSVHAPAQNLRSPTAGVLQSTSNSELFQQRTESACIQDTGLQNASPPLLRGGVHQPQATGQASCHTQQRTTTPPALAFGGQCSAEIQDASPPHEPVIAREVASQEVSYSVNFTGRRVSNGDQNGRGESCQWQGLGQSSPPEGSQATEAVTSQLFGDLPNTGRNFTPSLTSLSEAGAFFAPDINSRGAQMSATAPHYCAQEQEGGHYITAYLGDYGAQGQESDCYITANLGDYGAQEHGSDRYITVYLGDYGAQGQGSALPFVAGMDSCGA